MRCDWGPCSITALRRKLRLYRANSAQLGWRLLPEERVVEIWAAITALMAHPTPPHPPLLVG